MAKLKVVLDGIDLSAEQTERISRSIQRAVLNELADFSEGAESATDAGRSSYASGAAIGSGAAAASAQC